MAASLPYKPRAAESTPLRSFRVSLVLPHPWRMENASEPQDGGAIGSGFYRANRFRPGSVLFQRTGILVLVPSALWVAIALVTCSSLALRPKMGGGTSDQWHEKHPATSTGPDQPVKASSGYEVVRLACGEWSVRSLAHGETFHPVIGPVAEAEALYVNQLRIRQRVEQTEGEFVIWDVGLGAAANPVTVLNALKDLKCSVQIISFDQTLEPLRFALENVDALSYLQPYKAHLAELASALGTEFELPGGPTVSWEMNLCDFPTQLHSRAAEGWPKPHAILFDAYSPAKNPAMWTYPLFGRMFRLLDPDRPCAMPTYSRSTLLRVTLLLAGFFVGAGHATGEKEETTIAANKLELLEEPLNAAWLKRARNSTSAEPLSDANYRQAPLSDQTWKRLLAHPQFTGQIG